MQHSIGFIDVKPRAFEVPIGKLLSLLEQVLDPTLPRTGKKIYLNAFRLGLSLDILVDPYQLRGFVVEDVHVTADVPRTEYMVFGVYNDHEIRPIMMNFSSKELALQAASELSELIQVPVADTVEDFD